MARSMLSNTAWLPFEMIYSLLVRVVVSAVNSLLLSSADEIGIMSFVTSVSLEMTVGGAVATTSCTVLLINTEGMGRSCRLPANANADFDWWT